MMISVPELKNLVSELQVKQSDTGFRFRLINEKWHADFLKVVSVHEKGLTLNDETENKIILINDLSEIIQFELDRPFQFFQHHFHYEVVLRTELHLY